MMPSPVFTGLADNSQPITPFPPPPVAMALRVLAAGVTVGTVAEYCRCSPKSLERTERGVFENPRSVDKQRYAKALAACEAWLSDNKPGTLGDIYNLWTDLLNQARTRKVG